MAVTQPHGMIFHRRYGSFAGKAPTAAAPARKARGRYLAHAVGRLVRALIALATGAATGA